MLLRGAISTYNCDQDAVCKSVHAGLDVNSRTTNRDYSCDVISWARFFQRQGRQ